MTNIQHEQAQLLLHGDSGNLRQPDDELRVSSHTQLVLVVGRATVSSLGMLIRAFQVNPVQAKATFRSFPRVPKLATVVITGRKLWAGSHWMPVGTAHVGAAGRIFAFGERAPVPNGRRD